MPNPIEIFLDPVALVCCGLYAALILWEFLFPARQLPQVTLWPLRGLSAFVVYFLLSTYLPLIWSEALGGLSLFDASALPLGLQFAGGLLVYEGLLYAWHRAMHAHDGLWRSFHQFHHSAERLDTWCAFWFSPLDIAGFAFLGSVALGVVFGVGTEAATLILYVTFFLAVFQHANIRTPQWLGYFVQRPESHSQHHGRGIHRDNYADLPLFDLLFGTFRNPAVHLDTGFQHGASSRIVDMLLWRDLNRKPAVVPPVPGHSDVLVRN